MKPLLEGLMRGASAGKTMYVIPYLMAPPGNALAPWATSSSNYYEQITEAIAERYRVNVEVPWRDLSDKHRDLFLYGTNGEPVQVTYRNRYGRKRSYSTRFEGIIPNLERRYKETDSEFSREKIEEYMSVRPCPACKGARLKPESLAVALAEAVHYATTRWGAPMTASGAPSTFVVIGMGKLGGRELNVSSDIDLIFVYEEDGETTGGERAALSTQEYFTRLGRKLIGALAEVTEDGYVFRVDMRLRPSGRTAHGEWFGLPKVRIV